MHRPVAPTEEVHPTTNDGLTAQVCSIECADSMNAVLTNESELYLAPGWPAIRLIQSIGIRRKKESQSLRGRIVALVPSTKIVRA